MAKKKGFVDRGGFIALDKVLDEVMFGTHSPAEVFEEMSFAIDREIEWRIKALGRKKADQLHYEIVFKLRLIQELCDRGWRLARKEPGALFAEAMTRAERS
jgi:hypothetical protein